MLIRFCWFFLIWAFSIQAALSKTYIRDYTYKASEADSKITSRIIAVDQVKLILLQEIGIHIRQQMNITKDGTGNSYASTDVEAITAGLTKLDIIEEKWNGDTYYLKAKIEANTEQVLNALEEFKKNRTEENLRRIGAFKANQRTLNNNRKEIERLKIQLNKAKTETQKQKTTFEYAKKVNQLSIIKMLIKGFKHDSLNQYDDAFYWFRKAAEKDNAITQNKLGSMYRIGEGVPQNYQKSLMWTQEAADQGNADALFNLSIMYARGQGVKQDNKKALALLYKAAKKGSLSADIFLPEYGGGENAKWVHKTADEGDAGAQYHLGLIYWYGANGYKKDLPKAYNWFRKAAIQGHAGAQEKLGIFYRRGLGIKQDNQKALMWYRKAAAQDHSPAQERIGMMYEKGDGIEKNHQKALIWFGKSCESGGGGFTFSSCKYLE